MLLNEQLSNNLLCNNHISFKPIQGTVQCARDLRKQELAE